MSGNTVKRNSRKVEIVTLALLFALKDSNTRHFYRWLKRDYLPLFPELPERIRFFKQMRHREWKGFEMRLGFLPAIFNILQERSDFNVEENQFTRLSMAEFAL